MIPFSKTHITGQELPYIKEAMASGKTSGNGEFTKRCQHFFEKRYGFRKCLLTSSCTDALEMCAILLDLKPGDEVIIPSYTFPGTANPFILRGVKVIFADSTVENPNIDVNHISELLTERTKAIVVVHYAGIACDMEPLLKLVSENRIFLVEDAAHAIDSTHSSKPLGSFGHLSTFSFHDSKNIVCGEGGLLVINDTKLQTRAEIIWENGTNRAAFFRGETDKYTWVDVGSSYLPSEITAAFLFAQLESIDTIQERRKEIWLMYANGLSYLKEKQHCGLPKVPAYAKANGHIFYLLCETQHQRDLLIDYLRKRQVYVVFHYHALHTSPYIKKADIELINAEKYTNTLVRLPIFFGMTNEEVERVIEAISEFYKGQ